MSITTLGVLFTKFYCCKFKDYSMNSKHRDLYSQECLDEVLCVINTYFRDNNETIESIKGKNILINNSISLFYDKKLEKFCISYKYKGAEYCKKLRFVEDGGRIVFLPEEKKYLN